MLKIVASVMLLLVAAFAGMRVYSRHRLEKRGHQAVSTLHRIIDVNHDNFDATSVVYYPNTRAVCVEYRDVNDGGSAYSSRAVLVDGDSRISYAVDMNDDLWTKNCSGVYDRNLIDLTNAAK